MISRRDVDEGEDDGKGLTNLLSVFHQLQMRIDADTPPKSKIDTKNDVVENASPALDMPSCWVSKKDIYIYKYTYIYIYNYTYLTYVKFPGE